MYTHVTLPGHVTTSAGNHLPSNQVVLDDPIHCVRRLYSAEVMWQRQHTLVHHSQIASLSTDHRLKGNPSVACLTGVKGF